MDTYNSEDLLNEIKRRILAISDPEQIILFGSRARGTADPDSDFDLLIIEKGVETPRRESVRFRAALRGLCVPVNVLVATPQQIERYRAAIGPIYGPIVREGKVIYERPANT